MTMHVNFNLSVIITLYISQMSSSFLNALQKIICVMLMIKFLFLTGGCQSKFSSITWCSLVWCWSHGVLYYHNLWHRATLRPNRAIEPLTSMLCQESGLIIIQRFFLFGRSSSGSEELPSCHSDTAVSDKDSSEDIYAMDIHARYLSLSD